MFIKTDCLRQNTKHSKHLEFCSGMRFSSKGLSTLAGFTLVEVLIAVFILSVGILAWVSTQQSAVMGRGQSRTMTVAAEIVQAKIEELSINPAEVCDPDDTCDGQDTNLIGGFEYDLNWELARSSLKDGSNDIVPDSKAFWKIDVEASWNYRGHKTYASRRIVQER